MEYNLKLYYMMMVLSNQIVNSKNRIVRISLSFLEGFIGMRLLECRGYMMILGMKEGMLTFYILIGII